MVEYITKTQALEALETLRGVVGDAGTEAAKKLIKGLDEGIVRCQECKHLKVEKMLCMHPGNRVFNTGIKVNLGHFCSWGDPKGGQAPQREDA